MSDPISSATNDPQQHPPPKNKEDQKAAAALESLNTVTSGISGDRSVPAASAAAGAEALGKAMSRLEIAGGQEGKKKVNVKVAVEDVGLLVDQLDLSKIKATELLKTNDGDVKKAMRVFISPAVRA